MAEPGEQHDGGAYDVPYTPLNGHSQRCVCPICDLFWASPEGRAIHGLVMHWLRYNPKTPTFVVVPDDASSLEPRQRP